MMIRLDEIFTKKSNNKKVSLLPPLTNEETIDLINNINEDGLCAYALIHEPFCSKIIEEEEPHNFMDGTSTENNCVDYLIDDIQPTLQGNQRDSEEIFFDDSFNYFEQDDFTSRGSYEEQSLEDACESENFHYDFFDDPIFDDTDDEIDDGVANFYLSNIYLTINVNYSLDELI